MGDSRALKLQTQVQNVSAEEVRLDAKRSSDPDSLWKRGSQSRCANWSLNFPFLVAMFEEFLFSLLLGRVDSLGQYVRQFEDEPLHKAKGEQLFYKQRQLIFFFKFERIYNIGSKISSAVKNLVKSKPNKDKEEEARRIAESIVAGITNLNSNNAEFDSDDLNF